MIPRRFTVLVFIISKMTCIHSYELRSQVRQIGEEGAVYSTTVQGYGLSLLQCSAYCAHHTCVSYTYFLQDGRCAFTKGNRYPPSVQICPIQNSPEPKNTYMVSPCHLCPFSLGYVCTLDIPCCYKFYGPSRRTHEQSRMRCEDDGARLMRVTNEEKQSFIQSVVGDDILTDIWIDGDRSSGDWRYSDGTRLGFTFFNDGEGNDPTADKIILRKSRGYKWHDGNEMDTRFGVLCEINFE